jgi:hypothetical protein
MNIFDGEPYAIALTAAGVLPTLEAMTNEELSTAAHNVHNNLWKHPGGSGHMWPTKAELHEEMKKRDGWVTMCDVCLQWFAMKNEDEHVCPGYEVSDFQDAGGRY